MRLISRLGPGLLVCVAVTAAAFALEHVERLLAGEAYLEALVLAILLGVATRAAWAPGPRFAPGVGFSAKVLLEVAVVLLGASVSATTVLALGPSLLAGIAATVAAALASSYLIGRALGLPQRMAILVACGNSICGNSAIAAVAPVIGADGEDVASSIAFTAVLGVVGRAAPAAPRTASVDVADAIWRYGRSHCLRRAAGAGGDACRSVR